MTAQMQMYPGAEFHTTIESELLTILLIEVAPKSNLLPAQIHALDHLLRRHADHYRFSDGFDEQASPFAFQRSRNEPPRRWFKALTVYPGTRFFGIGGSYAALCGARADAESSRHLPEWLGSTRCTAEDYRSLLDRLVEEWSLQPPYRRQRREPCVGEILVAHDWSDIRRLVGFTELARTGRSLAHDSTNIFGINSTLRSNSGRALPFPQAKLRVSAQDAITNLLSFKKTLDPYPIEAWTLIDSSEAGLGAVAQSRRSWMKVGMMIAFLRPDSVDWEIALVRRLNCAINDRFTIGMTRMRGTVCAARLCLGTRAVGDARATGVSKPATIEYDALMLRDDSSTLLLPVGVFDPEWKFTMTTENRRSAVKVERVTERGLNFERVEFSIVESALAACA